MIKKGNIRMDKIGIREQKMIIREIRVQTNITTIEKGVIVKIQPIKIIIDVTIVKEIQKFIKSIPH